MQIILEEIDGSRYLDVIVTPSEIKRIKKKEMISSEVVFRRRHYYLGVRLIGDWDFYEEDESEEED